MTVNPGPTVDEIRAHVADGWTFSRIARHYGVGDTTVGRRAKDAGIKAPGQVRYRDLPDAATLTRMMRTETVAQIAARHDVRPETVRNRIKRARRDRTIPLAAPAGKPRAALNLPAGDDGRAACSGMDLHAFFPTQGPGQGNHYLRAREKAEAARAVCRACPIRIDCLRGALERREPWGIWGGQLFSNGKPIDPANMFNPSRQIRVGMAGDTAATGS